MSKPPSLRRLLARKKVEPWLGTFFTLDPDLSLALIEPNGRLYAQAGQPVGAGLESLANRLAAKGKLGVAGHGGYLFSPLIAGDVLVGYLAARAKDEAQARRWLVVASQGLSLMLEEANESRGLAAEALDRYREINLLYRLGETIGGKLDPLDILARILGECQQIIDADLGLALLYEPEVGWQPAGTFGVQDDDDAQIEPLLAYVSGQLAGVLRPAIVTEMVDHGPETAISSLLWAPLVASERLLGGVLLARSTGRPVFVANDLKLQTALSSQAAIAVETARLHQAELARQRMEKELQLGHELQASLIPFTAPSLDGWEFATWWHPAREVSGDFYDFIWLDGDLGAIVADVADKGVQAALFMALTRSTVRASLHALRQPAAGIAEANRLIAQDATRGMFVTLCYAHFRPESGAVTYVNAGHNPPFWIQAEEGSTAELDPTGTFLGYDVGLPFEARTIDLPPGDIIVIYTDGITEAMSQERVQFGEERFQRELMRVARLPAAGILEHIQETIRVHIGDAPQSDDITLVIAKRK